MYVIVSCILPTKAFCVTTSLGSIEKWWGEKQEIGEETLAPPRGFWRETEFI